MPKADKSREAYRAIFKLDKQLTRADRRWVIHVLTRREVDFDGVALARRQENSKNAARKAG